MQEYLQFKKVLWHLSKINVHTKNHVISTVVILHGYPFFELLLYIDNSEHVSNGSETITTTTITVLRPFFRDHPGEPVPKENFWTLWCKGRLTEADTPTIRMGATPSGLVTSAHLHHPHIFYRPDAIPAAQPTASKHRRQLPIIKFTDISNCNQNNNVTQTVSDMQLHKQFKYELRRSCQHTA